MAEEAAAVAAAPWVSVWTTASCDFPTHVRLRLVAGRGKSHQRVAQGSDGQGSSEFHEDLLVYSQLLSDRIRRTATRAQSRQLRSRLQQSAPMACPYPPASSRVKHPRPPGRVHHNDIVGRIFGVMVCIWSASAKKPSCLSPCRSCAAQHNDIVGEDFWCHGVHLERIGQKTFLSVDFSHLRGSL
jgi:hypothetical protein